MPTYTRMVNFNGNGGNYVQMSSEFKQRCQVLFRNSIECYICAGPDVTASAAPATYCASNQSTIGFLQPQVGAASSGILLECDPSQVWIRSSTATGGSMYLVVNC